MSKLLQKQFSAGKVHVEVDGYEEANHLVLDFRIDSDCILHWGLSHRGGAAWQAPPQSAWPEATTLFDEHAVQSVCKAAEEGQPCTIRIRLDLPCAWDCLPFVLYFPKEKKWVKSGGGDFRLELPRLRRARRSEHRVSTFSTSWLSVERPGRELNPCRPG